MSSKKYSRDFKLKVLEYYFDHGGDKKFGLKAKTAHHFCIDHKTVSRMLGNSEIVRKARRISLKKNGSEECKTTTKHKSLKICEPYVDMRKINANHSKSSSSNSSPSSSKSSQSTKKVSAQRTSSAVPILELPEDPDFSVLKSSIESSASSVSNVAKLLISGTEEVKRMISNECDLIYECKVCRNLFRSVINFLAHKRIYCQDEFVNVKGSFHKNTGLNMTSETSTVIVEPEPPPPEEAPPIIPECKKSALKIDQIASRLAKSKTNKSNEVTSHPSDKGSSEYFKRIETVRDNRRSLGSDCSVLLKDIGGTSNAVYQNVNNSVVEKPVTKRTSSHQRKRDRPVQLDADGQVVERDKETESNPQPKKLAVAIKEEIVEEETEVSCKSCESTFSSKSLLDAHVGDVHGIERTVYTCPICSMIFLSIWGCVKHLIRVHKKKKHQRERLKHVICSRAYKKTFTAKEIARQNHKSSAKVAKQLADKEGTSSQTEDKDSSPSSPSSLSSLQEEKIKMDERPGSSQLEKQKTIRERSSRVNMSVDEEPSGYIRNKAPVLPNTCPRCMQSFQTQTAMGAHLQFCSLASLSNSSETPEKKIAIQIRKDYKKDGAVHSQNDVNKDSATNKNQDVINLKIQERLREVCCMTRKLCLPCNRKYNTVHVLKRHASIHIGWTRFSCTVCSYKNYEKYLVSEHCTSAHRYQENKADLLIVQADCLSNPVSLPSRKDSSDKEDNSSSKSDKSSRKSASVQNGDYESSSASVVSEDSISIKSEFENQELESADVAYRELIKNIDICAESKDDKRGIKDISVESKDDKRGIKDISESKDETRIIKERRNSDTTKIERPHRTRKTMEQKDFVYEPLRSPSVGPRTERNDNEVEECPPRQRLVVQQVSVKVDRPGKRKESLADRKATKKLCLRVSEDIQSNYNHCNGRDSPGVINEAEKAVEKSSVNGSTSASETLPGKSDIEMASAISEVLKTVFRKEDASVSDKKGTDVKITNVPEVIDSPIKDETVKVSKVEKVTQIIAKVDGSSLKAKEIAGGTELKICKVKTIDAATAKEHFKSKSMTLIEVKTKDRLEVVSKHKIELKPKERVHSGSTKQIDTKAKKSIPESEKAEKTDIKEIKEEVEKESKKVVESVMEEEKNKTENKEQDNKVIENKEPVKPDVEEADKTKTKNNDQTDEKKM